MLLDMHIRDFVLISQLNLSWEAHLTALTGETGAGKSIVIDALAALLGEKVSAADIVRAGAEAALIEATFAPTPAVLAMLSEMGISSDDSCVLVSREINRNGRSKCRVNGQLATVSVLQRLGSLLIDIHSQHESQWLLSASRQLDMLDGFGGEQLQRLRQQVMTAARKRSAAKREHEALLTGERERTRQLDMLRYQLDEIAAAKLIVGEDAVLETEHTVLANAEHLAAQLDQVYQALYENENGAAADMVGSAIASLADAARLDPQCRDLLATLREVEAALTENAREVRRRREDMQANPERLAEVETRLELIDKLKRKYGRDVAEVLQFATQAENEIAELSVVEAKADSLVGEIQKSEHEYIAAAGELHRERTRIAQKLEQQVQTELRFLGMERASFAIKLAQRQDDDGVMVDGLAVAVAERGFDACEFLFSANPGEEARPLARVASGGELSRVMLALKSALASVYDVPTLIFDEIDAGLGGRTAQAVAQKLRMLAASRQVLCVTHLAQIAAAASHHVQIEKLAVGNSTKVELRCLSPDERVQELARMLDGTQSHTTLEHAREMLASAQKGAS